MLASASYMLWTASENVAKIWFAIPPSQMIEYMELTKETYSEQHAHCSNFYNHRDLIWNPFQMAKKFTVYVIFQRENQLVWLPPGVCLCFFCFCVSQTFHRDVSLGWQLGIQRGRGGELV